MKRFIKPFLYLLIIIGILYMVNSDLMPESYPNNISYTEFLEKAEYGDIEKIEIDGDTIKAYPYDSDEVYFVEYVENQDFIKSMREQEIEVTKLSESNNNFILSILSIILSFAPFLLLIWYFNKISNSMNAGDTEGGFGGMLFGSGKSKGKLYKQTDTGVKFTDVAGQEEAKESLTEIIDYLNNADKYSAIGAKLPKGALLIGPPGTGKTLLAKAVAGEANVPFYSITGSDFVEMFVGVGASRVRDMFAEAKKNSPCIVFIDEIDAIGKSRSGSSRAGGNDEREQTLNQLLSEMDGFDSTTAVVVLAATNRPEILDKALTRPGRFDRRIIVDKPDLKGREDILKVHSKDVHMDETVDLLAIAKATAGGVGADLSNIINEAALRAVRLKRTLVTQEDLMESVELVFAGKEKKDRVLGEKERKIVAYHEVGHAVVAALQKNSEPVQKITIVPRTSGALGYTMQVPEEEKFLSTKDELLAEIMTLMGGRCAEDVFFNTITTGASNDIEKITDLAKKMITVYGMNNKFGMIAFESQESIYLDDNMFRTCSEEYSAYIDSEMIKIAKECYKEVKNMLLANQELVKEVAELLLDKENITGEEFMQVFRKYHDETYSWNIEIKQDDSEIIKPVKTIIPVEKPYVVTVKNNEKDTETATKEDKKSDIKAKDIEKLKVKKDDIQDKPSDSDKKTETKLQVEEKKDSEKNADKKDEKKTEVVSVDNKEPELESSYPETDMPVDDYEIPPEQNDFEDMILSQMDFDNAASTEEEPPMPDFYSLFDDNSSSPTPPADENKKSEESVDKKTENKKSDDKDKQNKNKSSDANEAKQPNPEEPQKPKPAFEAPKPLKKKKKNKGGGQGQKQEIDAKPEQKPDEKQEKVQKSQEQPKEEQNKDKPEQPRDDLALLMSNLKNNPEELAQKRKNGKYINPNASNKKQNSGVLSPESNPDDFKNNDTSSFDLSDGDTISEDDY